MSYKLRATAKAALDWMESTKTQSMEEYLQVIDSLKAALAEPAIKESLTVAEQKPVGQMQESAYGRGQVLWFNKPADQSMLYTAPPRREWVGLTDEEIQAIHDTYYRRMGRMEFARAIEAKLKEKNGG